MRGVFAKFRRGRSSGGAAALRRRRVGPVFSLVGFTRPPPLSGQGSSGSAAESAAVNLQIRTAPPTADIAAEQGVATPAPAPPRARPAPSARHVRLIKEAGLAAVNSRRTTRLDCQRRMRHQQIRPHPSPRRKRTARISNYIVRHPHRSLLQNPSSSPAMAPTPPPPTAPTAADDTVRKQLIIGALRRMNTIRRSGGGSRRPTMIRRAVDRPAPGPPTVVDPARGWDPVLDDHRVRRRGEQARRGARTRWTVSFQEPAVPSSAEAADGLAAMMAQLQTTAATGGDHATVSPAPPADQSME
ncbi:hypothetical protein PR202_gb02431 [Eleusine coracana subsp. coracana]|uniref:Uncharacterized protein n=1 Tax=Eleusine coracana subsp. coracana TaxID=191504 RepID=A0AAV5DZ88_ELECO|nr:hypothetical protein PR202_gb02431 [Eleusine coracana subsp. coracana]